MQSEINGTFSAKSIKMGSFLKVSALFFAFIGFLFGLLALVGSALGGNVFITLGSFQVVGVSAGILGVPLMAVLFGLLGLLIGLVTFVPINWIYQRI